MQRRQPGHASQLGRAAQRVRLRICGLGVRGVAAVAVMLAAAAGLAVPAAQAGWSRPVSLGKGMRPSVDVAPNGLAAVAWYDGPIAVAFGGTASGFGSAQRLAGSSSLAMGPLVAIAPSGAVVVLWGYTEMPTGRDVLRSARRPPRGRLGAPVTILRTSEWLFGREEPKPGWKPLLAFDRTGRAWAAVPPGELGAGLGRGGGGWVARAPAGRGLGRAARVGGVYNFLAVRSNGDLLLLDGTGREWRVATRFADGRVSPRSEVLAGPLVDTASGFEFPAGFDAGVDARGGVLAAWGVGSATYGPGGQSDRRYASRVSYAVRAPGARQFGLPQEVSADADLEVVEVAMNARGDAVVLLQTAPYATSPSSSGFYAAYRRAGQPLGQPASIWRDQVPNGAWSGRADAAINERGDAVLAFAGSGGVAAVRHPYGGTFSAPTVIRKAASGQTSGDVSVDIDARGRAVVAWTQRPEYVPGRPWPGTRVLASRFDPRR